MSVSAETPAASAERLQAVLAEADFVVLPGTWSLFESPADEPPVLDDSVLAAVRDRTSWSVLRPNETGDGHEERFGLFSFHFPPGRDNSGFVGWLAGALKARLGTGVIVICGSNAAQGGIYDYWGCPIGLLEDAVRVVEALGGRRTPLSR